MITVTRRMEFDAAHRVLHHESKCKHLHGHRYVAEITVQAPQLDRLGRVVDFSVLKTVVGQWIDDNWDHNILLHQNDPLCLIYREVGHHCQMLTLESGGTPADGVLTDNVFAGKTPFMFVGNPTAENIAKLLLTVAASKLPKELEVIHVRVYETPNCWADAFPEPEECSIPEFPTPNTTPTGDTQG